MNTNEPMTQGAPARNTAQPPGVLRRLARVLGTTLLIAWFVLAAGYLVLRYVVWPQPDLWLPQAEQALSQALGQRVEIGSLRTGFDGLRPSMDIERILIEDQDGNRLFSARRAHAVLSLSSLLRASPVFARLDVEAPSIVVDRIGTRQILVAGVAVDLDAAGEGSGLAWLLEQRRIVLSDVALVWRDRLTGRAHAFERGALAFGSVGRRHRLDLRVPEVPGLAEGLEVAIEAWRPLFGPNASGWSGWQGKAYAAAGGAELAPLSTLANDLRSLLLGRDAADAALGMLGRSQIHGGRAALRLWVDAGEGLAADARLQLAGEDFEFVWAGRPVPFVGGELDVSLVRQADGSAEARLSRLALRDRNGLELRAASEPPGELSIDPDGRLVRGRLSLERFDSARLLATARELPLVNLVRRQLAPLRVSGVIEGVDLEWQGGAAAAEDEPQAVRYRMQARFNELSLAADARPTRGAGRGPRSAADADARRDAVTDGRGRIGAPSFERISGTLVLDEQGGEVDLSGNAPVLEFPGLFEAPRLELQSLSARARWRYLAALEGEAPAAAGQESSADADTDSDADSDADAASDSSESPLRVRVDIERFRFEARDAGGELQGHYESSVRGPGIVDLRGVLRRADATQVARYLPTFVPKQARDWVQHAIRAGRAEDARFVLKGDLAEFPFDQSESGEFVIATRARGVELVYAPDWPGITEIDGQLRFQGSAMTIENATGRIGGVALRDVRVGIDDLGHAVVKVSGRAEGPAQQMLDFVDRSAPLKARFSTITSQLKMQGAAKLQLELGIPVHELDAVQVGAKIEFAGNRLQWTGADGLPAFETVGGLLTFSEKGLAPSEFQGRFAGGPIRVRAEPGAAGGVVLAAGGEADAGPLLQWLAGDAARALQGRVEGWAPWKGRLEIGERGAASLTVESELVGLSSTLPEPFAKPSKAAWPLKVALQPLPGTAKGDRIDVRLRDNLRMLLERQSVKEGMRLRRGVLAVGTEPVMPDSGLAWRLKTSSLNLDAWWAVAEAVSGATADASAARGDGFTLVPTDISVTAGQLRVSSRDLTDVVLGATRHEGFWRANIGSREIDGFFTWRDAPPGQPIGTLQARFARLVIPDARSQAVEELLDSAPSSLPGLDVTADEFVLGSRALGKLELRATNRGGDRALWELQRLRLEHPAASFDAKGNWSRRRGEKTSTTNLDLAMSIRNAGGLLTLFGFPGTLEGGRGTFTGHVDWTGSPLSISYPTLGGSLKLSLGRGTFLKVDPGAAKLIGILNLQGLRRRLSFDFEDIFSEGFAFDEISASASIDRGVARTEDFRMQGVTAQVGIRGQTDLVSETQKLVVSVRPEINAALGSLAYAALINPALGLGTLLAQMILREPLAQAFSWEYDVTGTWSDPQVSVRSRPKLPEAGLPDHTGVQ